MQAVGFSKTLNIYMYIHTHTHTHAHHSTRRHIPENFLRHCGENLASKRKSGFQVKILIFLEVIGGGGVYIISISTV